MSTVASGRWSVASIVGVGLIGGSFALALRKSGFTGRIIGVSSAATVKAALERGVIDEAMELRDAAGQSDVIYLAQPISKILETLDEIDPHVYPGTLITDAGSTKREIVERAARRVKRGRFVGGHPMAGKESRGVQEAEADLFRDRPYVLTGSDAELERWIKRMGARVVKMDAAEHDGLVALTSHLPQLIATALAAAIGETEGAARVAGPAALEMTRLALSPWEIWRDIFATNAGAVDEAVAKFIAKLEDLRARLGSGEMEDRFGQAAKGARGLRGDSQQVRSAK